MCAAGWGVERSLRQNAGASNAPSSVLSSVLVPLEDAPIATQLLELARGEQEIGPKDVTCRERVVVATRFVEQGATRCDGGPKRREEGAVEEVDDDDQRVVRRRERPSREVGCEASDTKTADPCCFLERRERGKGKVDCVDLVPVLREPERVSSPTACEVERATSARARGWNVESSHGLHYEGGRWVDGRVGPMPFLPVSSPIVQHFEGYTTRANVSTSTVVAPASRSTIATARAVAPEVQTSSIRSTERPRTRSG